MPAPFFDCALLPFIERLEGQPVMHGAIEEQMDLCFAALRLIACAAVIEPERPEAQHARRASREQLVNLARRACVALELPFDLASVSRDLVAPQLRRADGLQAAASDKRGARAAVLS